MLDCIYRNKWSNCHANYRICNKLIVYSFTILFSLQMFDRSKYWLQVTNNIYWSRFRCCPSHESKISLLLYLTATMNMIPWCCLNLLPKSPKNRWCQIYQLWMKVRENFLFSFLALWCWAHYLRPLTLFSLFLDCVDQHFHCVLDYNFLSLLNSWDRFILVQFHGLFEIISQLIFFFLCS